MTDHAFQMTSHDVRAQEFQKALRGYDPAQVDEFKQRMAEEIDRLIRDRVALDERVRSMGEQLKAYRDRERALNEALVSAQQLRTDAQAQIERERDLALREAQAEAERVIQEATAEAERLLAGVRGDERRLRYANEAVRLQFRGYVAALRQLLERQLAELAALEDGASNQAARSENG